jgi:AraC-like DNA-binding protein
VKPIPIRSIHASSREPVFSDTFIIRDVRKLMGGKDMVQELHRHDFFFILALQKGKGNHTIDFTSYRVANHSVIFMRPGQVHEHTLKAGSAGFLIEFKPDFYPANITSQQLLRRAGAINFYRPGAASFARLFSSLVSIESEYTGQQEKYLDVIKANLDIFFVELVRSNNNPMADAAMYQQGQLDKFSALIETHVATEKQPSFYADALNLSLYQLNAIARAVAGKTSSEMITDYILLESRRYLLATTNQVTQIAYHLGYDDVSYFIRFFKKHTGHSPEAFRNKFR